MLKFVMATFALGWAFLLAVAFGRIAQDSGLGFAPLAFLMTSALVGSSGAIDDPENRTPLLLVTAAAFASCLIYAVLRFFMLFGWAGH